MRRTSSAMMALAGLILATSSHGLTGAHALSCHVSRSPFKDATGIPATTEACDASTDECAVYKITGNYLTAPPTPAPSAPPARAPVALAAGAATLSANGPALVTSRTGFTGSGYIDFATASAQQAMWTIPQGGAGGKYRLAIRYADHGSSPRPMTLLVDGIVQEASLDFPNTARHVNHLFPNFPFSWLPLTLAPGARAASPLLSACLARSRSSSSSLSCFRITAGRRGIF